MANRSKQPIAKRTPSDSEEPRARHRGSDIDLSDLDAPTNAFPIGVGLRGAKGKPAQGRPGQGKSSQGRPGQGKSKVGAQMLEAPEQKFIEWRDDTDSREAQPPINNDIDDLSEDEPFEEVQQRQITVPAWMLLAWFTGASLLFGLAVIALVAAILFT